MMLFITAFTIRSRYVFPLSTFNLNISVIRNQAKEGLENAVPKFNGSDGDPMQHHEKFCKDIARYVPFFEQLYRSPG